MVISGEISGGWFRSCPGGTISSEGSSSTKS